MAAENQSPAREPAARGRGRGGRGRGGRGRGGGRGTSSANTAVSKAASTKPGRGGSRRGRAKSFTDSRVQAAYERQRDLKATYQAVAHALKPALQELAERSIDEVLQQPDRYKQADEHNPLILQLHANLDKKMAAIDRRLQQDLKLAEGNLDAEKYVANHEFKNGVDEISEQFYESQENCLRILHALQAKQLPVDVRDDQYEYKVISDEELDQDFHIYECFKDGHLVPYPSRVEGTDMWRRRFQNDAAIAPATTTTPTRGRGRGRGGIKRRAADQPDGQPTPKKSTRLAAEEAQFIPPPSIAPAPAKGLLASAAEVDVDPEATRADEESVPASPEPAVINGNAAATQSRVQTRLNAREKSPTLPKNIGEPDDYGCRIYNQRSSMREKATNSRFLAPNLFAYEDWEVGFRDSYNDSTKGHTRAKRGKYLDTPNSNGMHFDQWCNGYDYSAPQSFDQNLVKRHGVHPKYGIFLPTSTNDAEDCDPYTMPGKPVVYIANPSGRILHASRSFQKTTNHFRAVEAPLRQKFTASIRRFCKMSDIDLEDIAITAYIETDENLRNRSLGTAVAELESRPRAVEEVEDDDGDTQQSEPEALVVADESAADGQGTDMPALSILTYATAFVQAQDVSRVAPPSAKVAAKPARYDAIRDVFTDAKPAARPTPDTNTMGLNFLAEMCNVESRHPEPEGQADNAVPAAAAPDAAPDAPPAIIAAPDVPSNNKPERRRPVTHEPSTFDREPMVFEHGEAPPPLPTYTHVPNNSMKYAEPSMHGYIQSQPRDPPSISHIGAMQTMPQDPPSYPVPQEHAVSQPPPTRGADFRLNAPPPPPPPPPPAPPSGPHIQDQGTYFQHPGYTSQDPRDIHIAPARPIDPGYNPRRMSSYGSDAPTPSPTYQRLYWPQQPPPSGPPSGLGASVPSTHAYPQPPPPPPPTHSRMPFSQNATAEPLPPLRPSRSRTQSIQEEQMHDQGMRSSIHGNMSPYYPPAPRQYPHRNYAGSESHAPMQPMSSDRMLPNLQQTGPGFMGSPSQGYAPQMLSPTFGNPSLMGGPMAQSPPGTPQGLPGSIHRHRSTPSGSSDAGSNKYRKLQPAPVPAHRTWTNKPELKTIPYDHKETGSSAALPSSGPTQIRGWNVNQPRKRSKAEKQERAESANERDDSR